MAAKRQHSVAATVPKKCICRMQPQKEMVLSPVRKLASILGNIVVVQEISTKDRFAKTKHIGVRRCCLAATTVTMRRFPDRVTI